MNQPEHIAARNSARRAKALLATLVVLLAATASLVLANIAGTRTAQRYDVTATGEHQLSPRAANLIAGLSGDYRVVMVVDRADTDAASLQHALDVLDRFTNASPKITSSIIEPSTPAGGENHRQLIEDLRLRDAERVEEIRALISASVKEIRLAGAGLQGTLSPLLAGLAASDRGPSGDELAAAARVLANDLSAEADRATSQNPPSLTGTARELADRSATARDQLAKLARELRGRTGATEAAMVAETLRDRLAISVEQLRRAPRLDSERVGEALAAARSVLIIGPPQKGLTAIDPDALLTSTAGASRAESLARAEELLTTAISALENPIKPIVVLVHAQPRAFLGKAPLFDLTVRRLATLGIDLLEWPMIPMPEEPSRLALDPDARRPVVYAVFSPAAWAGSGEDNPAPGTGLTGAERAARLGALMQSLIERGRPLLVSLNPSPLPGYGEPDPITRPLSAFGLSVDSARPLLRERFTPSGRQIQTDLSLSADPQPESSSHPILGAVGSLPVYVPWALPMVAAEPAGTPDQTRVAALLVAPADDRTWAESQWLRLMQTPRDRRAGLTDLPVFDEGRDHNSGPWNVAMACERQLVDASWARAVVIGSNSWFVDAVLGESETIDGRSVAVHPGNAELLEASIWWLAGQEHMIARSPAAASTPLVRNLPAGTLFYLRLALLAGVPLLILVAGAAYRVILG